MNQEEFDLYEKHQAFFREKMGPLVERDEVALRFDSKSFDVGFVTQTKTMEKDVISADLVYVRWYSDKPWRDQSCDKRDWAEEHFIRLPLPIDPVNPERGLWGMVDWFWWNCFVQTNGMLQMSSSRNGSLVDTPPLALLRAIDAQEEK